ncbi:hypothetical protein OAQ08_02815 [Alphaproteobacteria bacterium]|nr:hypothetical protein [Alphaproteobacteria bacterium]
MNIKSKNTFIKDICLTLGHFCEYDEKELTFNSYILSNSINSINSDYSIDSYGLLFKNKLLYKEPIILSNLNIHYRNQGLINKYKDVSEYTIIESLNEKIFYAIHLDKINHKYKGSVLKTLSLSKSSTIFFPTEDQIIIIADNENELKKYKKVFDKNNSSNFEIKIIKIPKKIKITDPQNNNKIIDIMDSSYLNMSLQSSDIIEENLVNSDIYRTSNNQISLMTKLNLLLLNFIPHFIAPTLLRFLQRHLGSFQFYKQFLGINYLISKDGFKYSDVFEYQNKLNYLVGSKIPNFRISKENKEYVLKDLINSEKNFLTSNKNNNKVFSGNKILISSDDYYIDSHTYALLNLETHSYVLTYSGLVLEVFDNELKEPLLDAEIEKTGYVDNSQLSIDSFNLKNFKPELPKLPKFNASKLFKFNKKT